VTNAAREVPRVGGGEPERQKRLALRLVVRVPPDAQKERRDAFLTGDRMRSPVDEAGVRDVSTWFVEAVTPCIVVRCSRYTYLTMR
jgi:hypothetical protein